MFFVGLIAVALLVCGLATAVVGYVSIAATLPSPSELEQRATQLFTSSQIYDRDGNLLYELLDPQGGKRTSVPLDKISPWLLRATIATEDPRFYNHPGFDVFGIVRAIVQDVKAGQGVSGASTIAQQLVRYLLLPEGNERTLTRKIREAVLAAEVTRQYPRDKILELYLNSINYGNLAYGVEAAAHTYFNKDAAALTLAEASLLAGIPQGPAIYDPFTPEGREAALARQKDVLRLMVEENYITNDEAKLAAQAMENYPFTAPANDFNAKAPHWVVYIRQLVEKEFGPEALYRGGLKIYTTLDSNLQSIAEKTVSDQIAALQDKNVKNGALISMDPRTGEILAMVGSPDFNNNAIGGQINMTLRPRQTGSVIKPLTYLTAFEKGWSPATVLWDVPVVYTDTAGNVYQPVNYDSKFHGPQTVRSALANSYNIPAVKTLVYDTVPDFLAVARRLGIDTLTRTDYGPALTLGGGEVPLIEMTDAFGTLANNGVYMPPVSLLRVEKSDGTPVCKFTPPGQDSQGLPACQLIENTGAQLVRPQHAYLLTNILSDNTARTPAFGANSVLKLSRPAAVKTGTTNDYKDNWTIGYTPDLVTGVWVGNVDNKEMQGVSGVSGAGPIWHNFMEAALANRPVQDFVRPDGLVEREVCAWSGAQASPYCPDKRTELFVADQPPPPPDQDVFQMLNCNGAEQVVLLVPDDAYDWAAQQGYPFPVATKSRCMPSGQHNDTTIFFSAPTDGATISGPVPLMGTVTMPNFEHYDLVFSRGWDSANWEWISGPHQAQVTDGQLGEWNTLDVEDGDYTLAIAAYGKGGGRTEYKVRVHVQNHAAATPLPVITETPLPLPTETPLPLPTETPLPLPTETPLPSPTATTPPLPTETPTETPTSTPAPSASPSPTPGGG
ncbi:MAG TPA: transglycosylase domain-containing protein [Anaerolineae bacterium]|nr:transglycosylase domain-containing protein [Anaerolineae bacterium]